MGGSHEFYLGQSIAVDPTRIERELAKLWKGDDQDGTSVTRACLSNVVSYVPDDACAERAAQALSALGMRYPSRLIMLSRNDAKGAPLLAAWISAVCHLTRPGASPVCCEEITLRAGKDSVDLLRGAVTPLLVPDVPSVLLFFGPLRLDLVAALEGVLQRVVLDSRRGPLAALAESCSILDSSHDVLVDDLAWRATARWRRVLFEIFEEQKLRPLLHGLGRVEVHHHDSEASAAILLSWLASCLGWSVERSKIEGNGHFEALCVGKHGKIEVACHPATEARLPAGQVEEVHLMGAGAAASDFLTLRAEPGGRLCLRSQTRTLCVVPRAVSFPDEPDVELLGAALAYPRETSVFSGALRFARELSASN